MRTVPVSKCEPISPSSPLTRFYRFNSEFTSSKNMSFRDIEYALRYPALLKRYFMPFVNDIRNPLRYLLI